MITRILLIIILAVLYTTILGTGFSVMLETQPTRFYFLMDWFLIIGAATMFAIYFSAITSTFRA